MASNLDDIVHRRSTFLDSTVVRSTAESAEFFLDVTMRDRFELLSAYLDGEVTPDERRQIERWLSEDRQTQALYHRLLSLRKAMRSIPTEPAEITFTLGSDIALHAMCQRVKIATLTVACTASAVILSSTGLVNPLLPPLRWSFFQPSSTHSSKALEIILDEPAIDLKAAEEAIDLGTR